MKNKILNIIIYTFFLLFFVNTAITSVFSDNLFIGFKTGDAEINTMIASIVKNNGSFYKDFSIPYGPGRYIILGNLFKLLNINFNVPVFHSYYLFIQLALAAFFISILVYQKSKPFFKKNKILSSFMIAIITGLLYLIFNHSGQEQHIAIILFLLAYPSLNSSKKNNLLLGILLGNIFFYRIELGILTTFLLLAVEFLFNKNDFILFKKKFLIGTGSVAILYLSLLIFKGSLTGFLQDVLVLGIKNQPRQMGLPIDPNYLLVFQIFFLLGCLFLIINTILKNKFNILLSSINLILFSSALGRSDLGHLQYGVVLFFPTLILTLLLLTNQIKIINNKITISLNPIILFLIFFTTYHFGFKYKTAFLPLLMVIIILLISKFFSKKTLLGFSFIVLMLIFFKFNSSQFIKFLNSQKFIPRYNDKSTINNHIQKYQNSLSKSNYGGQIIPKKDYQVLLNMKKDLSNTNTLIFPTNATLYYELNIKPPIRYFYFNGEKSKYMEKETIKKLTENNVQYVLFFNSYSEAAHGQVFDFIKNNYKSTKTYLLDNNEVVLKELKEP